VSRSNTGEPIMAYRCVVCNTLRADFLPKCCACCSALRGAGMLGPMSKNQTWVIVAPDGLVYVGLHENEDHAWHIFLGWPTAEDVADRKREGWYAAPAAITWTRP
jgi:hypothetical protein